ncbi:unnamed protein product [Prunus armeniaca]|uniref:Uncharacterized protein n=1 Tax=Prunus armeniaca TaxID=36596 RepID=A0A6J5UFF1_PRUAR|nr:unnamed protein product [Prunus armeniaca]CAB4305325.1 unnamed protein product [Prunus armeniaca]
MKDKSDVRALREDHASEHIPKSVARFAKLAQNMLFVKLARTSYNNVEILIEDKRNCVSSRLLKFICLVRVR